MNGLLSISTKCIFWVVVVDGVGVEDVVASEVEVVGSEVVEDGTDAEDETEEDTVDVGEELESVETCVFF